jgi:hypothetical protein
MSDNARQDFSDKAGAALKVFLSCRCQCRVLVADRYTRQPDSQKTTTEKISDTVKGHADSVGSTLQPQGEKSNTQKVGVVGSLLL